MSYELLRSLYLGDAANAELATPEALATLHVRTGLDDYVPATVSKALGQGRDLVLTGNPGDGKTHLVRTLQVTGALEGVVVELDLSARPTSEVIGDWRAAAKAERPYVMCANEGPLLALLEELPDSDPVLGPRAAELRSQVGRLTVADPGLLPPQPKHAVLIDLADRNVLDVALIEAALTRVCHQSFLPPLGHRSTEAPPGRNLLLLARSSVIRHRLASIVAHAGRRSGQHFTFRQLWAALAYGITAGKTPGTLRSDLSRGVSGLEATPVQNMTREKGRGALLEAIRLHGDPATVTSPDLDEVIWTRGQPKRGDWLFSVESVGLGDVPEPPYRLWEAGDREGALTLLAQLKRLVALAHEDGERLVEALDRPRSVSGQERELVREVLVGLRRLYLSAREEELAPEWLRHGLPLWVSNTYRASSPSDRAYVAVSCLPETEFRVLQPTRAPWLGEALGPLPDVFWLEHQSGVTLRVDPDLQDLLRSASVTAGPTSLPDRVQGFLVRLAGQMELAGAGALAGTHFAILDRPRSELVAAGEVHSGPSGSAAYA